MIQTCIGCGKQFENLSTLTVDQDVCNDCYNAVIDSIFSNSEIPLTPAQEKACDRAEKRMPR